MPKRNLRNFLGHLPLDRLRRRESSGLAVPPPRDGAREVATSTTSTSVEPAPRDPSGTRPDFPRRLSLRERAEPYVGSPKVRCRVAFGDWLYAEVSGAAGVYAVCAAKSGRAGTCSCPSKGRPCKHIVAVAETAQVQPHTFAGIEPLVERLDILGPELRRQAWTRLLQAEPRAAIEVAALVLGQALANGGADAGRTQSAATSGAETGARAQED